MSVLFHITAGDNVKRKKGENPAAALMITRHDRLGFRAKLQAVSDKRLLFRCVSDCPLSIVTQVLLWARRFKWKIQQRKNSIPIKALLASKNVSPLGSADATIVASGTILKNFLPPEEMETNELPNLEAIFLRLVKAQNPAMYEQMIAQKEKEAADKTDRLIQQIKAELEPVLRAQLEKKIRAELSAVQNAVQKTTQKVAQPKPVQTKEPVKTKPSQVDIEMQQRLASMPKVKQRVETKMDTSGDVETIYHGDGADKMNQGIAKNKRHLAKVHAHVAQKEAKEKADQEAQELLENLPEELEEIENFLDEEFSDEIFSEEATLAPINLPTSFKTKKAALNWSIEFGAFDDLEEATETFVEVKAESNIKKLKDFYPVWIDTVSSMMD